MPAPTDEKPPQPDDRRKIHDTPYLYTRAFTNDEGTRPLEKGTEFWNSPDINFFPKVKGNAMPNTEVTVQAKIWNDGYLPAVGVTVDFFWFTPALVFISAKENRINKKPVQVTIPAQSCISVTCPDPWIPTFIGDGHECLVVQCNSFFEGKDGLKHPLHAELDRHVAQRNLTVSEAKSGQKLLLVMQNPFDTGASFSLHLSSRLVRGNFARIREQDPDMLMHIVANAKPGGPHNLIERELNLAVEDTSNLDLGVRIASMESAPAAGDFGLDLDHYLQLRVAGDGSAPGRRLGQFDLGLGANRTLHLEVPRMELDTEAYCVLHFSEVIQDCILGGYTVVIEANR